MSVQQYIISELPQEAPMGVYAGDDVEFPFTIEEGDAPNFAPEDITGSTFTLRIEKKRAGTDVLVLTTAGGSIPITDAANGAFKVVFTAAQTTALMMDDPLSYDLKWTNAANKNKTLICGDFKSAKRKAT